MPAPNSAPGSPMLLGSARMPPGPVGAALPTVHERLVAVVSPESARGEGGGWPAGGGAWPADASGEKPKGASQMQLLDECVRAVQINSRLILEGRAASQDLITGMAEQQSQSNTILMNQMSQVIAQQKELDLHAYTTFEEQKRLISQMFDTQSKDICVQIEELKSLCKGGVQPLAGPAPFLQPPAGPAAPAAAQDEQTDVPSEGRAASPMVSPRKSEPMSPRDAPQLPVPAHLSKKPERAESLEAIDEDPDSHSLKTKMIKMITYDPTQDPDAANIGSQSAPGAGSSPRASRPALSRSTTQESTNSAEKGTSKYSDVDSKVSSRSPSPTSKQKKQKKIGGRHMLTHTHQLEILHQRLEAQSVTEDVSSGKHHVREFATFLEKSVGIRMDWHKKIANRMANMGGKVSLCMNAFRSGSPKDMGPCRKKCLAFLDSAGFQGVSAAVVVLNTVWIGVSTNAKVEVLLGTRKEGLDESGRIRRSFLGFFLLEQLFKIAVLRDQLWKRHDRAWNWFDLAVVTSSVLEETVSFLNLSFLRTVRLLRIARILKVVRLLRFFTGLRLMMIAVFKCSMTLVWAGMTIGFLVFMFGIIILQLATSYITPDDKDRLQLLETHFGSLPAAMFTLLLSISNGLSWGELANQLESIHTALKIGFTLYVTFSMYGILNVVIGVFVHQTAKLTMRDRDLAIQEAMLSSQSFVTELKSMLGSSLTNNEKLDWMAFEQNMHRPQVRMYLQTHNIDISEAEELYSWLDPNKDDYVSIDSFVYGLEMIKGDAKAMAIVHIAEEIHHTQALLTAVRDSTTSDTRSLHEKQDNMMGALESIEHQVERLGRLVPMPDLKIVHD